MQKVIEEFIKDKNIAIIGASKNKRKWGYMLHQTLKKKGFTVYPVNPKAEDIEGDKCYSNVKDLPTEVTNAIFAVPPSVTLDVVKECSQAGIKRVWMHRGVGKGAVSEEAIRFCKDNNIDYVYGVCPLMFFPRVGVHKIHLQINKMFGSLPKELKN